MSTLPSSLPSSATSALLRKAAVVLLAGGATLSLAVGPAQAASPGWETLAKPNTDGSLYDVLPVGDGSTAFGQTVWGRNSGDAEVVRYWLRQGTAWKELTYEKDRADDGIWAATSANDFWVLGKKYQQSLSVSHWNGTAWEKRNPADTSVNFLGIKAVSATDVWAVGESRTNTATSVPGVVGHWDGTSWKVTKLPQAAGGSTKLNSVQVNSATDIWAAGQTCTDTAGTNCRPYVVKYDGANWKEVATPTGLTGSLTKVVARGSGDVWVVGGTTALHWNGTGWTRADITLKGVTSFADLAFYGGQLYAGLHSGTDGAFARWNGQAWEAVTGPVSYSADGVRLTTATDGSLWVAGRTMSFFGSSSPFAARLATPAAG